MGFTELVKNILGGGFIQSGHYINPNINIEDDVDISDEEFERVAENPKIDERDEYDIFGETVASKLRLIKLDQVKENILKDIDSIICDAILGQGKYGPLTRKIQKTQSKDANCDSSTSIDESSPQLNSGGNGNELVREIYY